VLSTPVHASKFRLADHVRACRVDEQVILLDLKRDKYHGVGDVRAASVSDVIVDWPDSDSRSPLPSPSSHSASVSALLQMLTSQAMLVSETGTPKPRAHLDEALESWRPGVTENLSNINWQDVLRLGRSAAGAACWLQWNSLAQIESKVLRLRPHVLGHVPTRSDELHRQVSSYMRVRPFIFSARERCLHDSLSLIRFLAARSLFPRWVIGVRTRPFAAHSWVQSGNLVLNDLHDRVRAFRPILVV
jgi:hypothetical protein